MVADIAGLAEGRADLLAAVRHAARERNPCPQGALAHRVSARERRIVETDAQGVAFDSDSIPRQHEGECHEQHRLHRRRDRHHRRNPVVRRAALERSPASRLRRSQAPDSSHIAATFDPPEPGAIMELGNQRASGNVEDRRGMGVGGGLGVGGIVIALVAYFLGFDPSTVINVAEQVSTQRDTREVPKGAPADEAGQFVSKVLGSTEDVWSKIFQQSKGQYHAADARPLRRRRALGLRHGAIRDGSVLLSQRREALPRPLVLPRSLRPLPRTGRFRPGLRDRARGGPPRAEADRHASSKLEARGRGPQAGANQTAVQDGAAGRLLCRVSGDTTPAR